MQSFRQHSKAPPLSILSRDPVSSKVTDEKQASLGHPILLMDLGDLLRGLLFAQLDSLRVVRIGLYSVVTRWK